MLFKSARYKWRFVGIFTLLFVVYTEYLSHYLNTLHWSSPQNCQKNCTRILLVADPQLIGETFDIHFYNGLAIYDSDNYLRRTFNEAFQHVNPSVIIFLGDIFDEGSAANDHQYSRYLARFQSIFQINSNVLKIIVPGDNDIGGENGEIVTPMKLNRFKSTFKNRRQYSHGNLNFYEINRVARELPLVAPKDAPENTKTIAVSHFSLLFYHDDYSDRSLQAVQPDVIFSGHLHRSLFIKRSKVFSEFTKANPLNVGDSDRFSVHHFDLSSESADESYLEILVPTCSYRMGEQNVGFGMAVIEGDNLFYTVLWSVDRFKQLISYIVYLVVSLLLALLYCVCTLAARKRVFKRNMLNYAKV